jgi:glycerophosphoryl diester phosphodiesterase
VMHDKKLDRTTTGKGPVGDRTLAELRKLKIRWDEKVYEDEHVPSLEEVLDFIPAGKRVFIEVKVGPEIVPELKRVIAASDLNREQIVVISFNIDTMRESKKAMPEFEHYFLAERKNTTFEEVLAKAKEAKCDGVNLSIEWPVTADMVQRAKEAGLDTYVWTIREKQALIAAGLAAMDVAGITTDFPDKAREWIKPVAVK